MEQDLSELRIDRDRSRTRPPRSHRARGRLILLGLVILALGLAAYLVLPLSREVHVATVSRLYPSQTFTLLNASGYVVAQRKASVAAKTTGRLVWIGVEEGSRVREGEILARLESEDVEAARLQAEAEVGGAAFDVAVAEADIESAKAELVDARANYQRMSSLVDEGFVARSEFDAAQARLGTAEAALSAARARREATQARLAAAKAALVSARVSVEYTNIRAPFDAVILTKNADVGDIITPLGAAANAKASVVTIADLSSLQVEADVAEANLAKVSMGQPTQIQLDAFPLERFSGRVHMIVPTADRSKATVLVKVGFATLDPRILPEMSAKVAFLERPVREAEREPRLVVPASAIVEREGGQGVFLVKDSKAVLARVVLGERLGDAVEVREGLANGDRVVVDPPQGLNPGDRVKVLEG